MAFPRGGFSSTVSRSNWNLEVFVFDERGKPEYPEKNLSEQSREPTTKEVECGKGLLDLWLLFFGEQ